MLDVGCWLKTGLSIRSGPTSNIQHPKSVRGGAVLETALWVPILVLLLVGMVQIAKVTFTYYTLKKTLYTAARYVSTQQGVDFCNAADPAVLGAINLAITGNSTDAGGLDPILPLLTPDMITINIERVDPTSGVPGACDCSVTGCDTNAGGGEPDFVVASIPNGYAITPFIPGVTLPSGPILLKPTVRVPFGGT
jgi:TadE-like protein